LLGWTADTVFLLPHEQAMTDLDWKPEFDLIGGLTDSYTKDFGRGTFRKAADFTTDDVSVLMSLARVPCMSYCHSKRTNT